MVKGDKAHQDIRWSEATQNRALDRVRQLLENVTWNDQKNGPRFPEEDPPQRPEAEFDECIKRLAWAGKALHYCLWKEASEDFQDVLRQVSKSSDQVIQVIRLATNFLFPWSALYDFDVPSEKIGAGPMVVCKGFTRPGFTCQKCLQDCHYPTNPRPFAFMDFGARATRWSSCSTPRSRRRMRLP